MILSPLPTPRPQWLLIAQFLKSQQDWPTHGESQIRMQQKRCTLTQNTPLSHLLNQCFPWQTHHKPPMHAPVQNISNPQCKNLFGKNVAPIFYSAAKIKGLNWYSWRPQRISRLIFLHAQLCKSKTTRPQFYLLSFSYLVFFSLTSMPRLAERSEKCSCLPLFCSISAFGISDN